MSLYDFLKMWAFENRTIVVCKSEDFEEMYEMINRINKGDKMIVYIQDYMIDRYISDRYSYRAVFFIAPRWKNAKITNFYIGKNELIVWVDTKKETKHGKN